MSISDVQITSKKDVIKTFILAPQWTSFQSPTFVTKTLKRRLLDIILLRGNLFCGDAQKVINKSYMHNYYILNSSNNMQMHFAFK